jgi:hypothetical protein
MSKADISTTLIRSRRAVLAGIASAAALPIAGALPIAAPAMDFPVAPVSEAALANVPPLDATPQPARTVAVAAVERYRKASKLFDRRSMKFSDARDAAQETHGNQPLALIHWRNSFIGGSELNWKRKSLLIGGEEDPATIELEYRDAKKRYRAALKAEKGWEKRAGVDGLAESMEQARAELYVAREALGTVGLESIADATAILKLLRTNLKQFGEFDDWEIAAFNNASEYLATVAATA